MQSHPLLRQIRPRTRLLRLWQGIRRLSRRA
jgi:hypothetical protein